MPMALKLNLKICIPLSLLKYLLFPTFHYFHTYYICTYKKRYITNPPPTPLLSLTHSTYTINKILSYGETTIIIHFVHTLLLHVVRCAQSFPSFAFFFYCTTLIYTFLLSLFHFSLQ